MVTANDDVPGLPECRALKEAGWDQTNTALWWLNTGTGDDASWLGDCAEAAHWDDDARVAAPSVGQLMAFIRAHHWWAGCKWISVNGEVMGHGWVNRPEYSPPTHEALNEHLPNALASAIAAALVAEGGAKEG